MENQEIRKLACVKRISNIFPIENADLIELAIIGDMEMGGWQCVVKKGEFQINDLAIYCEIDSILPDKEPFEFLRKNNFRIKTRKIKSVLSQGILFPLSILNLLDHDVIVNENEDVTELMNVTKWEPKVSAKLSGDALGSFPIYLSRTDQLRIQNFGRGLREFRTSKFECTEKLDGSSLQPYFNNGKYGVCSRNLELRTTFDTIKCALVIEDVLIKQEILSQMTEEYDNKFTYYQKASMVQIPKDDRINKWNDYLKILPDGQSVMVDLCKSMNLEDKLKSLNCNLSLQGEIIGPGIQGNSYGLKDYEYRIFDIWNIDLKRHMLRDERLEILEKLDLLNNQCPFLEISTLEKFNSVNDILLFSEGKSMLNSNTEREGIVFKMLEVYSDHIISFKAISNKWLLKNE